MKNPFIVLYSMLLHAVAGFPRTAIQRNGIMGEAKKSAGYLVFYRSKGQNLVRTKPASYNDAKTETQVENRAIFTAAVKKFRELKQILKLGFVEGDIKLSEYNRFMKENTNSLVFDPTTDPVTFDPTEFIPSKGKLLPLTEFQATSGADSNITLDWTGQGTTPDSAADDNVQVLCFAQLAADPTGPWYSRVFINAATRGTGSGSVSLDLGDEYENTGAVCFAFCTSADDRQSSDSVSDIASSAG